jgi:F-type H+-transporting ATPase subunit alpha
MDLAQYRELEAFAKFGSDLDKSTQQTLRRGSHLVELLKQDQYVPMPVEKQVVSLFTGTNGYLDDLPLVSVQRFEKEFIEMMEIKYSNVLDAIAETKELSKDLEANLHTIAKEFVQKFKETIK